MLLVVVVCMPVQAGSLKKRIAVFTPTTENNTYWPQVYRLLNAVANDLGIEISPHEFDVQDRFSKHIEGVRILSQAPRPDAAILSVAYGNTKPLLEAAETLGIPVFVQGPLFPSELPEIGYQPRKKYGRWVGYFYQDEKEKGYRLGCTLLSAARTAGAHDANGDINVVGIGGDFTWFGSQLRKEGLRQAVDETPGAVLLQVVPTKWTQPEGARVAALLLERYPQTNVVWAASDQLAIGACESLADTGRILGETAFVGGLDLSLNGLRHVQNAELYATVAGSMFSYAEILVYLFDYLHGIDFADEVGTVISTSLYTATAANAKFHLFLSQQYDCVQFKRLSKFYNRNMERYDFSLGHIMHLATDQSLPE